MTATNASSEAKIDYGTDAGMLPHKENWREFPMMFSNGISELRALKAATSVATDLLGLDGLGVIAEGKTADIIAMPGDPLADIEVTGQVDFVMKDGVIHRPTRRTPAEANPLPNLHIHRQPSGRRAPTTGIMSQLSHARAVHRRPRNHTAVSRNLGNG